VPACYGLVVYVRGVSGVDSVSRIFTCMSHTGVPYFQMGQLKKNWSTTLHQIFRVCRGHKGQHNYIILRGSDEGILRGERGEEKFLTPHISPHGGQGALKFLRLTEIYRPHVQTKCRALEFKRQYGGGVPKEILPFWGVASGAKQISYPLGDRNLFSAP